MRAGHEEYMLKVSLHRVLRTANGSGAQLVGQAGGPRETVKSRDRIA